MADVGEMKFAKVYDCLVVKAERKGRSAEEVDRVTKWLTGYKAKQLDELRQSDRSYRDFFAKAPAMNPNRALIKGKICGVQVETIEDPFMRSVRQLDKLVDELAKGKTMEQILRAPADTDTYIELQEDSEIRDVLRRARAVVRDAVLEICPDAVEKISWGMPTWWAKHNLIHMAPSKKHLGIYPGAEGVERYAERLTQEGYAFSKGAVQFPYKRGIPYEFIREIAAWCAENNRE